jgi:hypothetical protein
MDSTLSMFESLRNKDSYLAMKGTLSPIDA